MHVFCTCLRQAMAEAIKTQAASAGEFFQKLPLRATGVSECVRQCKLTNVPHFLGCLAKYQLSSFSSQSSSANLHGSIILEAQTSSGMGEYERACCNRGYHRYTVLTMLLTKALVHRPVCRVIACRQRSFGIRKTPLQLEVALNQHHE